MQKTESQLSADVDPVIAEVRRVREELLSKHDFDLHKVCEDLREREKKHPVERFVAPKSGNA